jgi:hypothetical protein
LTSYLTKGEVTQLAESSDVERRRILAEFERSPPAKTSDFEYDVFITYSVRDESLAHDLAQALGIRGLRVFLDWSAISTEDSFKEPIEQALGKSRHMVAILSGSPSRWQHFELGIFWNFLLQSPVERKLIPVLGRRVSVEELPPFLRQLAALDASFFRSVQRLSEVIYQTLSGAGATSQSHDDPQKGRWGGRAEANGRLLTARVTPHLESSELFHVQLEVRTTSPEMTLSGIVRFHLHPTFKQSVREVKVRNGVASLKLIAWGAFTVGVEADEGKTQLELDLSTVEDAPEEFRHS